MRRTWVRVGDRSVSVQFYEPRKHLAAGCVVVVPAFGFEAEVSYRTMRALAARAQEAGFVTLLMDLCGSGDSAPLDGVDDVVGAWSDQVTEVCRLARRLVPGVPLTAVGYRLGASLVAALPDDVADRRLCWEPVSGRQFIRRQQLLAKFSTADPATDRPAQRELLSLDLTTAQLASLRGLPAPTPTEPAAPNDPDDPDDPPGREIETVREPDRRLAESAHLADPYFGEVPFRHIDLLIARFGRGAETVVAPWEPTLEATVEVPRSAAGPQWVRERFELVGHDQLYAVTTTPGPGANDTGTWVVFTAQGAERSSGPSNAWAGLSRALAGDGYSSVRADRRFIGWHTDPHAVRQANPFSPEAVEDVAAAIRFARDRGSRRIVVVGSCSGAWLALAAARLVPCEYVLAVSVPAWSASPDDFDVAFLDRWHGAPRDGAVDAVRRRLRAKLLASIAGKPRLLASTTAWRLRLRAAGCRSLGLPVLRDVPAATEVHLVLSGRDLTFFQASAGTMVVRALRKRGRRVRVSQVEEIDHALRTVASRRVIEQALREAVAGGSDVAGVTSGAVRLRGLRFR